MVALPVKTALLVPGDDIIEVAHGALEAAGIQLVPTDIVAICESPLAITQGRIRRFDDVHPGWPARAFCRLFGSDGSLATAYGMQAAIDEAGLARVTLAVAVGVAGRLVGRRGDFYRIAPRRVTWIDDVSGTMPPYTQDIVLGPADPYGVSSRMAAALGCGAAVVDANDLGRVEVLGASPGIDQGRLIEAMRANPQGNDDERTPLVLVRP